MSESEPESFKLGLDITPPLTKRSRHVLNAEDILNDIEDEDPSVVSAVRSRSTPSATCPSGHTVTKLSSSHNSTAKITYMGKSKSSSRRPTEGSRV